MKNIALTGGTGFIGSHFLKQSLGFGHNVIAIRRNPLSLPRISLPQVPFWLDRHLNEVEASDLEGCDVLVHLATHSGNVPYDSLENCLYWNLTAVLALFEQARLSGIRRFIVAGSCFEYGTSGERFEFIPTDAPLEPTNRYATSKALASIALKQWAQEHDLSLEILRVFHVYGEGELKTRFWPSLRRAALGGEDFPMSEGAQIRDFMPVEDVARSFLQRTVLEDFDPKLVQVFNLSTDNPISIRSFAEQCWLQWNANGQLLFGKVPYRTSEVMRYVPGNNKLSILSMS